MHSSSPARRTGPVGGIHTESRKCPGCVGAGRGVSQGRGFEAGPAAILPGDGEERHLEATRELSSAQQGVWCDGENHQAMKRGRSRSDRGAAPVFCSGFPGVALRPHGRETPEKQHGQVCVRRGPVTFD